MSSVRKNRTRRFSYNLTQVGESESGFLDLFRSSFSARKRKRRRNSGFVDYHALEPRQVLNAAPVVRDDLTYFTQINTNLSGNVLSNDYDAEGGVLQAIQIGSLSPANAGALTLNSNGSFVFSPSPSFTGSASWSYYVQDPLSAQSNHGKVSVLVGPGLSHRTDRDMLPGDDVLQTGVHTIIQPFIEDLQLRYRTDDGRYFVRFEAFAAPGTPTPSKITVDYGGYSYDYSTANFATGPENMMRFAFADHSNNTGRLNWSATVTLHGSGPNQANLVYTFQGEATVVNRNGSEYGDGWWLEGQDKLFVQSAPSPEGALLVEGDGTTHWFAKPDPQGPYILAEGDGSFSQLETFGQGHRLVDKWGNERRFDQQGRIIEVHQRKDLGTPVLTYSYEEATLGRLSKIVDYYGREYVFDWPANDDRVVCTFHPNPPLYVYPAKTSRIGEIDLITGRFDVTANELSGPAGQNYVPPVTTYKGSHDSRGFFWCGTVYEPSEDDTQNPPEPLAKRTFHFDGGLLHQVKFHNMGVNGNEIHTIELSTAFRQGLRTTAWGMQPIHYVANDNAYFKNERGKIYKFKMDRFGQ